MASTIPVRRISILLALVAVVLIGFGAFAGLASASDEGLPESFQLAERHGGDKGTWLTVRTAPVEEITSLETGTMTTATPATPSQSADAEFDTTESTTHFEWLPEEAWQDGSGNWYAVHGYLAVNPDAGLTTTVNGRTVFTPGWSLTWHETSTGDAVGRTGLGGGGASSSSDLLGDEEIMSVMTRTTWEREPACGLPAVLRAGTDLDRAFTVQGCAEAAITFRADGIDTVSGVDAVRFEATTPDGRLTYWFNPGIPEPLRILSETDGPDGTSTVERTLADFTAGTDAWDTGLSPPAKTAMPAIDVAPRMPWGPDDSGVDHPFPLSDAWTRAAEDPVFADFRDFLEAHPDALAVSADYFEQHDGSAVTREWRILVTDGTDFVRLAATQSEDPVDGTVADLLGLPATGPTVVQYGFETYDVQASGYPPLAELQVDLPTVASVLGYAAALGIEPGNGWGLGTCWGPCSGGLAVYGGNVLRTIPADPLVGEAGDAVLDHTVVGIAPDGTPVDLTEVDEEYTREAGLLGAGAGVQGGSQVEGEPSGILQGTLGTSAVPVSAAGLGAVALLSAAVAFLWPALKGLPAFGLFSRVHGDRLLEHPVRARIMAAIEAKPGAHYQELLRGLGGGKGALEHHVRKLEEARLITAVRTGRYTCYFPGGAHGAARTAVPALKSAGARLVLGAASTHPGISGQALASQTGLSPSTVSTHVSKLAAVGLVRTARSGRTVHVQATPLGAEVLATV